MNELFMARALELAGKGRGFTSPNPCVGAVVVNGSQVIGVGYHKKAGEKHAEIIAIESAQKKCSIKNSTLFVTLEPCCHFGKTPPCVDYIISSGIKRVVIGMKDPFSKVNCKSIKLLQKHGIKVDVLNKKNKLYREIKVLNQPFIKLVKTGLPHVTLKVATSLDGKIASRTGKSKWITGIMARDDAYLERSLCDAIIVGSGTVKADDPELYAHGKFKSKKLLRVIIDQDLSLDIKKKVFRDKDVFIACTDKVLSNRRTKFEQAGIEVKSFGRNRVSIKRLLYYLGKKNIQSVYVEGGAGVHGSFYDSALEDRQMVDKVIFYIAPKIIGGVKSLPAIGGLGVGDLSESLLFKDVIFNNIDNDIKIVGTLNFY